MRSGRLVGMLLAFVTGCNAGGSADSCGEITADDHPEPRWVQIDGSAPVSVTVSGGSHPVAGTVQEASQGPAFVPSFPLTPGVTYVVAGEGCEVPFTVPERVHPAPRVVGVFPSASTIPENVLRFYVRFSHPMAEGDFLEHIRLERVDTGEDLTGVFFDNIHELWSADRTRITLLVDPGRVKTGLHAHTQLGRAFVAGGSYRLHIRPSWTSAVGVPLQEGHTHAFAAAAEDRQRVDPASWTLRRPVAGTRQPLHVDFHESVDHVSVHRLVRVVSPEGEALAGRWSLGPGERTAAWTPRDRWATPVDGHTLVVSGRFEDVAANNLNAALDHPLGQRAPGDEGRVVRRRLAP